MATKTATPQRTNPSIDVKVAVQIAVNYLKELFPTVTVPDISLEEVEFDNGGWRVTLGFTDKHAQFGVGRAYKVFKINSRGGVESMKIRSI